MSRAAGYEYLEHPSDVRIRAWGSSLEETFTQACLGMWALIAGDNTVPLLGTWTIRATGADYEELLVKLLNEQILELDVEGRVAGKVCELSITGTPGALSVCAVLDGSFASELPNPIGTYPKAAAYGDIRVSSTRIDITIDV